MSSSPYDYQFQPGRLTRDDAAALNRLMREERTIHQLNVVPPLEEIHNFGTTTILLNTAALADALDINSPIMAEAATQTPLTGYTRTGDTILANAAGAIGTIDGVTVAVGDIILLQYQPTMADNGPWRVVAVGDGSTKYQLARPAGADSTSGVPCGQLVYVCQGTLNGGQVYQQITPDPTVNTDQLRYIKLPNEIRGDTATTAALDAYTRNSTTGILTANANGVLTVDGYTYTSSDVGKVILVKNETGTAAAYNMAYVLTQYGIAGGGGQPWILTPVPGLPRTVYVQRGTENAGTTYEGFKGFPTSPTLGTTPMKWSDVSGAGGNLGVNPSTIKVNDTTSVPLRHYPLDEGAALTAKDYGSQQVNGSISGASWTAGRLPGFPNQLDWTLDFDGVNDYVDLNTAAGILRALSSYTISMWVKLDDVGTQQDFYMESNTSTEARIILGITSSGFLDFNTKKNTATANDALLSNQALQAGVWYHICAVMSGAADKYLYINGQLDNTGTSAGLPTEAFDFTRIGGGHNGAAYAFFTNGKISNVQLFSVALTAGVVEALNKKAVSNPQHAFQLLSPATTAGAFPVMGTGNVATQLTPSATVGAPVVSAGAGAVPTYATITGTAGTNVVYSGSPTIATPTVTTSITGSASLVVYGGSTASQTTTISSTSHGTKGYVYLGSSSGAVYDETNVQLTIGSATPLTTAHAVGVRKNADSANPQITVMGYSDTAARGGVFGAGHARGTVASPTALQSGDDIGYFGFIGQYNTAVGNIISGAQIKGQTGEIWSDTAWGTTLIFLTRKTGGSSPALTERFRITAAGQIQDNTGHADLQTTLTYASPTSIDPTLGNSFKVTTVHATGSVTFNAASAGLAGQPMKIIIVNDATAAKTITFGTNFKPTATIIGTASQTATILFESDGTNFYEVSRTLGIV